MLWYKVSKNGVNNFFHIAGCKCDQCETHAPKATADAAFYSREQAEAIARTNAREQGWYTLGAVAYCPDCFEPKPVAETKPDLLPLAIQATAEGEDDGHFLVLRPPESVPTLRVSEAVWLTVVSDFGPEDWGGFGDLFGGLLIMRDRTGLPEHLQGYWLDFDEAARLYAIRKNFGPTTNYEKLGEKFADKFGVLEFYRYAFQVIVGHFEKLDQEIREIISE